MLLSSEKVAVVTGSNKGIGFGIVKQLCQQLKPGSIVYLTARDEGRGQAAVKELEKLGFSPKFHLLDITNLETIIKFRDYVNSNHGGIDILVNNAAILFKEDPCLEGFMPFNGEPVSLGLQAVETVRTNYFGTLNVWLELFPLLRKGARVVNVSTPVGHLSKVKGQEPQAGALRAMLSDFSLNIEQLNGLIASFVKDIASGDHVVAGWPNSPYTVSKVGVCALTRIQQRDINALRPKDDIVVNSVHPGWVATDLSGHTGPMTIEEGAVAPVWCALLPPEVKKPKGEFIWRDLQIVEWEGELPGAW
jgi:carbonyl reductase 1